MNNLDIPDFQQIFNLSLFHNLIYENNAVHNHYPNQNQFSFMESQHEQQIPSKYHLTKSKFISVNQIALQAYIFHKQSYQAQLMDTSTIFYNILQKHFSTHKSNNQMSEIQEKINSIINEAIQENEGEDNVSQLNFSEKGLSIGKLTPAMKTAIQKCPNVDFLGLSECGLKSLDNLPNLPKLDTIDLKGNELDDNEIKKLKDIKHLKNLYIEANKIADVETIQELGKFISGLTTIEIASNPVSEVDGFSDKIWKAFTHLEVLNQHDKNGNKVEEQAEAQDEDEGDESEEEEDYNGAEQSEDSAFSQADYESQNQKPKKKRKTK